MIQFVRREDRALEQPKVPCKVGGLRLGNNGGMPHRIRESLVDKGVPGGKVQVLDGFVYGWVGGGVQLNGESYLVPETGWGRHWRSGEGAG